jgi:hypothetical protein
VVGRPLIIQDPADFEQRADAYFARCTADGEPPTVTGLALGLGLSSRQSLDRYGQRPEFRDVVRRAKLVVEHSYEKDLRKPRPGGSIFALKNMGWSDQREVTMRGMVAKVDIDKLPDAVIQRICDGIAPLAALAEWAETAGQAVEQYLLPAGRGDG